MPSRVDIAVCRSAELLGFEVCPVPCPNSFGVLLFFVCYSAFRSCLHLLCRMLRMFCRRCSVFWLGFMLAILWAVSSSWMMVAIHFSKSPL